MFQKRAVLSAASTHFFSRITGAKMLAPELLLLQTQARQNCSRYFRTLAAWLGKGKLPWSVA